MNYYYKTTIQYDGTNYSGFQWQKGFPTIQSEFNNAISKLIPGKFTTAGSSRTDSGVHALEQIVKITSEHPCDLDTFLVQFNKVVGPQIRCIEIETSTRLFKPAAEKYLKEYRYFFTNKKQVSMEDRKFIANISNELDIEAMQTCIHALIGNHDFCNFYSKGSNVKTTIREIIFCELSIVNPHDIFATLELFPIPKDLTQCFQLKIIANGFLKQMIRHIVSGLWMVGSGKITPTDFLNYLNGPACNKQLWKVSSPNGLFLFRINSEKKGLV
jgi:tRNA pseudouridine38-40 synthase